MIDLGDVYAPMWWMDSRSITDFKCCSARIPRADVSLITPPLDLHCFDSGAWIRTEHQFREFADPWRQPATLISTLTHPMGTFTDKVRVARMRWDVSRGTIEKLYERPEQTSAAFLRGYGFSERIIEQFFRPFFGGVMLDNKLETSSRMLEFAFRMFAQGAACLPKRGMESIPRQLADSLPDDCVILGKSVAAITERGVDCDDGQHIDCDHVVVATEADTAARILDVPALEAKWGEALTYYFVAKSPTNMGSKLYLAGAEQGPIQTVAFLSDVCADYAPQGKGLIAVNVSQAYVNTLWDDVDRCEREIRDQLNQWFDSASDWELLRRYRIRKALPRRQLDPVLLPPRLTEPSRFKNTYVCGDHRATPSIDGAICSGERAAEEILSKTS